MADIVERKIEGVEIGGLEFGERWGVLGKEYVTTNGSNTSVQIDFQDLMINVTQHRATAVEQEVLPIERRMRWRNQMLEKLGSALSEITGYTNKINTSDEKDPDKQKAENISWSDAAKEALQFAGATGTYYTNPINQQVAFWTTLKKYELDKASQQVKTKTDRLNNDASQDSTRLQSLVDHRDQAYQTATTLMTSISDTRTNLIRNLG